MKTSTVILAASLLANACIAALLLGGAKDRAARERAAAGGGRTSAAAPAATAPTWDELQTPDLAAQVARLRAEDFPPEVIRAVIGSQVRERFAARRKALAAADAGDAYWLPPRQDPQTQAELRALAREERQALAALLGPDLQQPAAAALRRLLPHLPDEKIAQLTEVRERYDEQRSELYAGARGPMLPEDAAKIDALDEGMRAEFAAILTPAELEDYDLRASRIALQLRNNLAAFDATEAEFRTLYKLQRAFEEQFPSPRGSASRDQIRARGDAQRQLFEEIKTSLGEARYADYQRATDYNFRQTTQLVARLDLAPEAAHELYAFQQEIQARIAAVGRTPATPAEREVQRSTLAAEVEAKLTAKLGSSGYEAYKQYGGTWLQKLNPPPPRKK